MTDIIVGLLQWSMNFLIKKLLVELLRVQISDLADKQLISKFKKGFRLLLCVNDAYSKYAWVIPLKDSFTITSASHKIFFESNCKPNKI